MPVVRYQIRNEYGLADPDLYGAADRDDPEALLEGVAMAGLVGVLRQLGDLAEFAAEIFHNLHEEVMATSARGHSLMLRVQQLEAEFPAIEKAFLTQTNHSHLTYNAGIELHPNIQIDQNLVTSGDMPRFILDSYEECRGPPRLFMLDKFDVAGAGACLKRYSDPSFFKTDFASSGNMEPEVHREKKTRKTKKKALRWRNVENSDSLTAADVNSMLQQMASEKAPQNAPAKRSKLKMRPLSSFHTATGRSYMEPVLERYSPEPNIFSENTAICSSTKTEPVDCNESTLDVYDIVIDSSANNSLYIDRKQMQSPDMQNTTKEYTDEWRKHKINESIIETLPADEKGILSRSFSNSEQDDTAENIKKITLHKLEQKEVLGYADNKTDGSSEVYVSDDVASELDSYMDALAIMDSEIETDNESKPKSKLGSSNVESHVMDSEVNGKQEDLQFQNSGPDSHSISSEAGKNNTLVEEGTFSPTNKDFARMLADRQLLQGEDASGFVYENSESCTSVALSANLDTGLGRDEDKSPGVLEGNTQIIEMESSESTSKDGDYTRSKNEEESPHHVTESISSLAHSPPPAGVEEAQSATTNPSAICLNSANTAEVSQQSDATLDEDLDAAELVNEISKSHADGTETTDLVGDLESAQVTVELSSRIEESIPQPEDSSNVFSDVSPMLSVTKEDEIPRTNFAYIPENEVSSESGIDCISVDLENIPSDDPTQIPEDIVLEIASLANQYSSSPSVERELVSLVEHESEDDPVKKTLLVDTEMELLKERSLVDALPCGLVAEEENIVSRNADLECSKSETVVGNTINVSENDLQTSNILRSEPVALCDTEEKQVVIDDTVSSELKASSSVLDMVHGTVEVFSDEFDEGPLSTGELHLTFDYVTSDSPVNILPTERKIVSHSLATKNTHEKDGIEEQDYVPLSSEEASISQTSLEERSLQDSDLHKHKVDKSESSLPIQDISMVLVAEKTAVLLDSQNEQNEVIPEARPHDLVTHTIITSSSETDTLVLNQFSQTKMSDHTEISLSPADGNEADKLLLNGEQHADVEPFPKRDHILSNMHEERAAVVSDRHLPDLEIIMEAASPNKLPVKADVNKSDTTEQNAIQSPDYPHPENLNYICEADQSCPNNDLSTCREDDVNVSLLESDAMGTEDNSRPSEELSIAAATGSDANCKSCENSKLAQESPPDPDFKLETGPSLEHFTTSDDCSDLFDKQMKQPVTETRLVGTEDNSRPSEELSIAAATLSDANCKSCEYSKLAQETALDPDFRLETGPSLEHFITSDGCSDLFDKQMKQSVTETQLVDVSNFVSDKSSIDRNANNASVAVSDKSPLDGNTNNGSVAEAYNALQSSSELSTRSVENINELDKSLSVASTSNSLLDSETSIPLQSNSELSVTSLESISNVSLPSISNLDMPTRKSESSGPWSDGMLFDSAIPAPNVMQCNLDAAPPLPPLPPLQWRMGKLRGVAPLAPTRVTVEPFAGSNPFSQLPFSEHPQGYSRSVVEGMEPMDSFAQVHNLKYNNSQHGSLIPAEVSSLASSETAPMAQGKKHDPAGGNVCNPSSTQAAYSAKNEQYFYPPGALQQQIMPVLGPYAPGKEFQQCASEIEGKQMHQNNASTPQISEKEPIHPSNPFLGASATEAAKYQYKYRLFGVEQMAHQSLPMPLPPVQDVMPPHGYFMPLGENLYNPYYITLPEVETEKPNGRPRSILNRPRDPLIEAVASHDKSTLRKVSEIVQAPTKPKEDDRNTLLDQIRKKSFNLKPAAVAKPNIKGPATNLKVAAILEKANAIRQACAGSDEDEDNWSDG